MLINGSPSHLQNYPKPLGKVTSANSLQRKDLPFGSNSGWMACLWGWLTGPCASMVPYASWSVPPRSIRMLSPVSAGSAGHWQSNHAEDIFCNLVTLKFDCVCVSPRLMIWINAVYWQLFFRLTISNTKAQINCFSSLWNHVEQIGAKKEKEKQSKKSTGKWDILQYITVWGWHCILTKIHTHTNWGLTE